ncbi:MAG: restriction endonuclease subunit S [Methylotenera sp.]|nr:restriction endonuclease subunit S [Methylotenera sp.]MDD4925811.1 restriction endonuclease subunit S [Methylotenera sp.]
MSTGWQSVTLKDLCVVDWGNTNLTKSAYVADGEFLAVSAAGCDGRIGHKEHLKHTPVLSAIGAQCGRMFFPEEDFTAIKNTISLTPKDGKCNNKFLYYLLTFIDLPQRGAGQPFISKGDIEKFNVIVPPLPVQQRIVSILDEAFSGIATATANAEKNLANARALFESYLQSVFENKGESWQENILKEVCELKSGTTISPSLERNEGDVLYTKVGDMNLPENMVEINTSSRFVNSHEIKMNQIIPEGAIIFPKRGGAIATNKKRKIVKPTIVDLNTMAIIPSKKINKDYLFHWFQLFDLSSISNGANVPQINNYSFDEVYISFPTSLMAQEIIVQKLDELSAETKKLEAIYQQKLIALDELKKSILNQAFSGQLQLG